MITQTLFVIKAISAAKHQYMGNVMDIMWYNEIEYAHNFTDYKTCEDTIKTLPSGYYQIEKIFVNLAWTSSAEGLGPVKNTKS